MEKEFNAQVDETIKCKSFEFKIENEIEKLDEMFRSLTINVSQIKVYVRKLQIKIKLINQRYTKNSEVSKLKS